MPTKKTTKTSAKPKKKAQPKKQAINPRTGKPMPRGKPFVKGDERINRKGTLKPKSQREFEQMLDYLFEQDVSVTLQGTKQDVSMLFAMAYKLATSSNVNGQMYLINRRFGKMPDVPASLLESGKKEFEISADLISPSFFDAYRDIKAANHVEYLFEGGRGSTKSSFVSLIIPYLMIKHETMHALVLRNVKDTLRDSVFSQLQWAINELGLADQFLLRKTPLEIEYKPTGQMIYFRGADEPAKIKSIKPVFGHIGILWLEELDQFKGAAAVRNIEQSAIRGGDAAYILKSFNPPRTKANWANKYKMVPKENQLVHHSDYRAVPDDWLGKVFLDEADHLKKVNPDAYKHEYLGEIIGSGGMVFENVKLQKIPDDQIAEFDDVLHGVDWGYFPDPFSYGRCYYDAARMTLYIFDEYSGLKHSNKKAFAALTEQKGITKKDMLIADSAEPKSIADFREWGLNCRAAEKGPDSKDYSIKWLQSLAAIVIDPKRAPIHAQQFLDYEYLTDKDGEIISAFPDGNDDAIDDIRYATNLKWRRRGQ